MKFKNVKNTNNKKVKKFLKIIFPVFSILTFWKFWQYKSVKFLQVKKQKKIMGLLVFSSFFLLGKKFLYLKVLALDKQKRGKGYGSRILEKLQKRAQKTDHNFMILLSNPTRKKAHNFYLKNGFKRVLHFFFWKRIK